MHMQKSGDSELNLRKLFTSWLKTKLTHAIAHLGWSVLQTANLEKVHYGPE
jgi:hypothetical protein